MLGRPHSQWLPRIANPKNDSSRIPSACRRRRPPTTQPGVTFTSPVRSCCRTSAAWRSSAYTGPRQPEGGADGTGDVRSFQPVPNRKRQSARSAGQGQVVCNRRGQCPALLGHRSPLRALGQPEACRQPMKRRKALTQALIWSSSARWASSGTGSPFQISPEIVPRSGEVRVGKSDQAGSGHRVHRWLLRDEHRCGHTEKCRSEGLESGAGHPDWANQVRTARSSATWSAVFA